MASKNGIALTAAIAAGIVGSSFLVWLIPQRAQDIPRTDADVMSDVYSRHLDLASKVESDYASWMNGTMNTDDMLSSLSQAQAQRQELLKETQRQTAQEWQKSYGLYQQGLDVFGEYLDRIETAVQNGNREISQDIESLKSQWQDYVDQAVKAIPA